MPEKIERIGWENIHSDTNYSIEVFDKITNELPPDSYAVASAHFWKIQCYMLLKQYDKALEECDQVSRYTQYTNLTDQMPAKRKDILKAMDSTKVN
ncbi:MAG TPA: hypothetical protein VHP14_15040 [Anaerolineales bacterium]|nr:hypothetical protein [Anaerolineales bacterium]